MTGPEETVFPTRATNCNLQKNKHDKQLKREKAMVKGVVRMTKKRHSNKKIYQKWYILSKKIATKHYTEIWSNIRFY